MGRTFKHRYRDAYGKTKKGTGTAQRRAVRKRQRHCADQSLDVIALAPAGAKRNERKPR